jgi:Ca2+-binding RTX toxin-like protein
VSVMAGNDRIIGSSGVDNLAGMAGNDTYVLTAGDTISEAANGGNDTAESSVISLDLANYANVENIRLTGSLTLSAKGNAGANILDGSANTAVNALTGLGGNDTYILGLGDLVIEAANGGTDTVQSSVRNLDLALFANVENATLTGSAALFARGTAGANVLSGISNLAANVLTGLGGNDIYTVGTGDTIVETSTGGTDTVQSSTINLSLANYANVENVRLYGSLARSATGNSGNNILNGESNTAANTLTGLAGNDTYYVGLGDVIVEAASGGTDTVRSSTISLDLANYLNVENVTLGGSAALFARGNSGANILNGESNSSANNLDGGAGNDTYFVGVGDIVNDTSGVDLVRSSTASVNLLSGQMNGVENVTLGGSLGLSVRGNAGANIIIGNAGANNMSGEGGNDTLNGGLGSDILSGGDGLDVFVFNTALSPANIDLISDFDPDDDTIHLENAIFTAFAGIAAGTTLSSAAFRAAAGATAASTAAHRIIYDTNTGNLYYDADGVGGTGAVQFADLGAFAAATGVTAADFIII